MSNSIRFHLTLENRIRSPLPLPNFPSDFPTDLSNHQIIGQWDAGFRDTDSIGTTDIHNQLPKAMAYIQHDNNSQRVNVIGTVHVTVQYCQ